MPINNLSVPLTHFIGREKEIAQVMRLSAQTRLLTLTGSGGCGKTRFALEVATRLLGSFEHGVVWVELAPLSDAALVPHAVAQVLGVLESADQPLTLSLANYLRPQQCLLILDNCEHLISACAHLVQELLQACPSLSILATSREALNVAGETAWRVPPLQIPDPETTTPEMLLTAESASLFVDRANSTEQTFAVNSHNANAIAQICRRLDGMPLAIELAAARVKSLPVEQIAARLDDRFRLLNLGNRAAPPRHQTLRSVIDWSYGLLSPVEKILFRRLAVFSGGWTLEAAEAICTGDGLEAAEILDALTRLVDKSLVIAQNDVARYRMLETIRQYAVEKLSEADELQLVRARHCDFFVHLAEIAEPKLRGAAAKEWMDRLEVEFDNVRGAFETAMASAVEAALRLTCSLVLFWVRRKYLTEGRRWLAQLLARTEFHRTPALRLQVLNAAGYLEIHASDSASIYSYFTESLKIARRLGDKEKIAYALFGMGRAFILLGDFSAAKTYLEKSLKAYDETRDQWGTAHVRHSLGSVLSELGDENRSQPLLEESLQAFDAMGDICDEIWPLTGLGDLARRQADYDRAVEFYAKGIEIDKRVDNQISNGYITRNLGLTVLRQGNYRRAAGLLTESAELLRRRGTSILLLSCLCGLAKVIQWAGKPASAARLLGAVHAGLELFRTKGIVRAQDQATYDSISESVRAKSRAKTYARSWQAGHALNLEQAVEFAMSEIQSADLLDSRALPPSPRRAAKEKFGGLTAREREVAVQVARGRSNREIAKTLVLSERTIEGHVGNILAKLDFSARTQIVRWAVESSLLTKDARPQP